MLAHIYQEGMQYSRKKNWLSGTPTVKKGNTEWKIRWSLRIKNKKWNLLFEERNQTKNNFILSIFLTYKHSLPKFLRDKDYLPQKESLFKDTANVGKGNGIAAVNQKVV